MKKLILSLLLLSPMVSYAAGHVALDHADVDLSDKASLQRGLKYVANYCLGCHSMAYSRYNRVGLDLGVSDELMKTNIISTRDEAGDPNKVGALMKSSMTKRYAKEAFGTVPPDLSLTARSRGADWLYSYLRGFYLDDSRPFGVNNTIFPDVGMPHVLWDMQGWQTKKVSHDEHGGEHGKIELEPGKGTMSSVEYDQVVLDIVNFMAYVSEPIKVKRQQIGLWVMLFLAIFTFIAYLLKKEYWKDVEH
jgi:ubiquinol-cytochrome c reductase cytochrome c1 subunit